MERTLQPARAIAPGQILKRELKARGWTQIMLARITKQPVQAINEIVTGTRAITADTALQLAEAFGTSAEFWTNLEARCRFAQHR